MSPSERLRVDRLLVVLARIDAELAVCDCGNHIEHLSALDDAETLVRDLERAVHRMGHGREAL